MTGAPGVSTYEHRNRTHWRRNRPCHRDGDDRAWHWATASEPATLDQQPVFACRIGALTPQERTQQKEPTAQLEQATTRVTEDADSYTFDYAQASGQTQVLSGRLLRNGHADGASLRCRRDVTDVPIRRSARTRSHVGTGTTVEMRLAPAFRITAVARTCSSWDGSGAQHRPDGSCRSAILPMRN